MTTITVHELIELLRNYPREAAVVVKYNQRHALYAALTESDDSAPHNYVVLNLGHEGYSPEQAAGVEVSNDGAK